MSLLQALMFKFARFVRFRLTPVVSSREKASLSELLGHSKPASIITGYINQSSEPETVVLDIGRK